MKGNRNGRAWAEVDLDAAEYNFNVIRNRVKGKLCCVVKANAYGHGGAELARLYSSAGADYLAVATAEEALELRRAKERLPVLVMGYSPPALARELADAGITQAVYSKRYASALINELKGLKKRLKIHIKLDTGMGRLGFLPDEESLFSARELKRENAFYVEGAFTHFSVADEGEAGRAYTAEQYKRFMKAVAYLEAGGGFEIKHCSNTAAIFDYPEYGLDMSRAGISLYGLLPSRSLVNPPRLKRVMSIKTVVAHVKTVEGGTCVSYGREFVAKKRVRLATLPIGYADGFYTSNGGGRYSVKINGGYAPVVGRACMDQIMVDVSTVRCREGDEVLIFGDDERCSADAIAELNDSLNYEVVCSIGRRVSRRYVRNGLPIND